MTVAIGYVKIDGDRIEKSPDMRVQKVIALVFDTFAELKSIRQVLVWLRHEQIRLPVIPRGRAEKPVEWRLPVYSTLWHMLKNPVYTGAYAYGRRAVRVTIDNGRERLSRRIQASSTDWEVLIPGHHDGYVSAKSWSCRVERIIARVEVGDRGANTRFVVTSLKKGSPRWLYQQVHCRRGQAENHIKSWKTHLAADRTSFTRATANQLRLFLHAGAYWLMWGLPRSGQPWRRWFHDLAAG